MKFTVGSIYRVTVEEFPMFNNDIVFKYQHKEDILIYLGIANYKMITGNGGYLKFYSPRHGILYTSNKSFNDGLWPQDPLEEI